MLVIRLFRTGKKNQPTFKIVVTDKRNPPRGGRFLEEVGFYNPLTKEKVLKKERVKYWLSQGVKPSDTVHNLLVKEGVLTAAKIPVHKKPKKKEAASPLPEVGEPRPEKSGREKPAEAPKAEALKEEAPKKPEEPKKEEKSEDKK